jgi:hypothetical protein
MSALPYILMCVIGFVVPMTADAFIKRKWSSTLNVRKVCQIIGERYGTFFEHDDDATEMSAVLIFIYHKPYNNL